MVQYDTQSINSPSRWNSPDPLSLVLGGSEIYCSTTVFHTSIGCKIEDPSVLVATHTDKRMVNAKNSAIHMTSLHITKDPADFFYI